MTRHITVEELGGPPWWLGHEHPERSPDEYTAWSWDCDACMMHLIAAARYHPDHYAEEVTSDGELTRTTVVTTLAEARAWRAEKGLRPL